MIFGLSPKLFSLFIGDYFNTCVSTSSAFFVLITLLLLEKSYLTEKKAYLKEANFPKWGKNIFPNITLIECIVFSTLNGIS
jgi:hypothetical protein